MDVNSKRSWCTTNDGMLNVSKYRAVYFARETNMIAFEYKLRGSLANRNDTVQNLGVFLDSGLNFHQHLDCSFSQGFEFFGSFIP
jgi:hypothetical protein